VETKLRISRLVGDLHTEFASASFVQHGGYLSGLDDGFEYEGHRYRFEPEYAEEELLERRMQRRAAMTSSQVTRV